MSVANRVGRLERDHFAEACRQFRPWFHALPETADDARATAELIAAGMPVGGTRAELRAWFDAQPQSPLDEAMDPVMELLMDHPGDHAGIRAALARLAPYLVRCAGDPPLTILAALRAVFLGPRANVAAYRRARGACRREDLRTMVLNMCQGSCGEVWSGTVLLHLPHLATRSGA
jgi:hypothetical protein